VRWIESGGSRVVAVPYTLDSDDLTALLGNLNGIVIPGGPSALNAGFQTAVNTIVNFATQQNNEGNVYPVYGIDQGALAIAVAIAGSSDILESCNSGAQLATLQFTQAAASSDMYTLFPSYLTSYVSSTGAFWFNNTQGIAASTFTSNSQLSASFSVLSTSTTSNQFVSSFEGNSLPIYGVQYHPEKNAFEWDSSSYNHDYDAVQSAQLLVNHLIDDSRSNFNVFPTPQIEDTCLIYNQNATLISGVWAPMYFFNNNEVVCLNQDPFHSLEEPFWYTDD